MNKFEFMSFAMNRCSTYRSRDVDWNIFRSDQKIKVEKIQDVPDLGRYFTSWYVDEKQVEVPFGDPRWYAAKPLALKHVQEISVPDGYWEKIESIDLSQLDEIEIVTAELPQNKLLLLDGNKRMCAYFSRCCKCKVTEYRIAPYCELLSLDTKHEPWPKLAQGR